jgi:hypothetical protein
VLVQIRSDLRLRFATFPPARRAITVLPLSQRPRSVRIRAAPFVVFSSTASDVLQTRPCCSRANLPCTLCSCSSASSCLTCVRPALPHHSRAHTRVFAPPGPTPASAKPLTRARQSRLQHPPRALRSTPVHTSHFRTPSLARSRHPLGVARVPAVPAPAARANPARPRFCSAAHALLYSCARICRTFVGLPPRLSQCAPALSRCRTESVTAACAVHLFHSDLHCSSSS